MPKPMPPITPESLRELSVALRAKGGPLAHFAEVVEKCAVEIESRDAQIKGLALALDAAKEAIRSLGQHACPLAKGEVTP